MVKNIYKCLSLALFFIGFVQINGNAEDLDKAFVLAVERHDAAKVQELIEAGADVNTLISYEWTDGTGEGCCDYWIKGTAFMYAVDHKYVDVIKVLLKVKKKLNTSLNAALARTIASQRYFSNDVAEALIEGGADINYVYNDGRTPLMDAIYYRRGWIANILLKAGADVTCVDKHGETALMIAVEKQDLGAVLDLLKVPAMNTGSFFGFGTKPKNYADKDGNTALILAVNNIRYRYYDDRSYNECKRTQDIVEALLKSPGIDPYHVNKNGETAIVLLEKLNKEME